MYSKELIKGTLKPIILKLLAENGRMYGYEITREVRKRTENKIVITEGALYPTLHRLEAEGIVKTDTQNIGKRVRKYYSLTQSGTEAAKARVNEFLDFINTMRILLNPKLNPGLNYG